VTKFAELKNFPPMIPDRSVPSTLGELRRDRPDELDSEGIVPRRAHEIVLAVESDQPRVNVVRVFRRAPRGRRDAVDAD
jgi:hypothetical protein